MLCIVSAAGPAPAQQQPAMSAAEAEVAKIDAVYDDVLDALAARDGDRAAAFISDDLEQMYAGYRDDALAGLATSGRSTDTSRSRKYRSS